MATLDPKIQKLLNDFSKSQPALQQVGVPAAKAGVQLGDLLAQALAGADATEAYAPAAPSNWTGSAPTTASAALDRLAAAHDALLTKLDADAGVTDTNYSATLKP